MMSKKSEYKKALNQCEKAWKEAVKRRAKGFCEVHGEACKDPIKQADHFIEGRKSKMGVFLDPSNGTYVCRTLNFKKSMKLDCAAYMIGRVVERREGMEKIEQMIADSRKVRKWTIFELEEHTVNLNGMFQDE